MVGLALLTVLAALLAPPVTDELASVRLLEAEVFAPRGDARPSCGFGDPACAAPENTSLALSFQPMRRLDTRGAMAEAAQLSDAPFGPGAGAALEVLDIPVELNGRVLEFVDFFEHRGKFIFARWFARKGRYEPMMTRIFAEAGLPPELIYVCMIESGFNPDAVSRASAVGHWQFMEPTAKQYGLRLDAWIDERRDPVKATHAAAKYLARLHGRMGSWPLALAAYNAGPGRVYSAIREHNHNDYWALARSGALPEEASRYVPKIMAAMVIGHDPQRYGFGEVRPQRPWDFVEVLTPGGIDVHALAEKSGIDGAVIADMNPELRRGFTPPDGADYPLRVPRAKAHAVDQVLAKGQIARPSVLVEHTVRFGERVRDIAHAYGASGGNIRRVNRLGAGREPPPGVKLLIPDPRKSVPTLADELLVNTDPGLNFSPGVRREVFFPVRRPMGVGEVAAFFGVRPGDIGMWNAVDPQARLQRGMVLRLFVAPEFDLETSVAVPSTATTRVAAGTDAADLALAEAAKERSPAVRRVNHKVRRGDSIWSIARRYDVSVAAIKAENGLARPSDVVVGKTLKIPVLERPKPKGKAAKRRPKANARRSRRYTIKPGDSLWKVARKHGVELEVLLKRNGLAPGAIVRPGQTIRLP